MKNQIKIITFLYLAMASLMSSCSRNNPELYAPYGAEVTKTISFEIANIEYGTSQRLSQTTRSSIDDEPSTAIKNLWAIQINGTSESSQIVNAQYIDNFTNGVSALDLNLSNNIQTLVYVANTFDPNIFEGCTTLSDINSVYCNITSEDDCLSEDTSGNRYFIMNGYIEQTISEELDLNTCYLSRNIARVTFVIKKKPDSGLTIKSARLRGVPSSSFICTKSMRSDDTPVSSAINYDTMKLDDDNTLSADGEIVSFYMPINRRGINNTISNATDKWAGTAPELATFLEIMVSDAKKAPYGYSIYLGANLVNDFNIESNTEYIYTLDFNSLDNVEMDLRVKSYSYSISFGEQQEMSTIFDEVFELVDENGDVVAQGAWGINTYRFKEGKENWEGVTDASDMFRNCTNMYTIELPDDWQGVTNAASMFYNCKLLHTINLPDDWGKITSLYMMFGSCSFLENITLPTSWGEVNNIAYMFRYCSTLNSINLPSDWGNVTSTAYMFTGSELPSIDLPDNWGSITNTSNMFYGCDLLTSIKLPSSWGNVTSTYGMLRMCESLNYVELPSDWGKITNVSNMFGSCNFTSKASGVQTSSGVYRSPSVGVFPSQCYRTDFGLSL